MTAADYLTTRQVAQQLGYSPQTVSARAAAGDIPGAFQLADRGPWRFDRLVLEAWLDSKKNPDPWARPVRRRRAS